MGPKIFASGTENERLRWQESEDELQEWGCLAPELSDFRSKSNSRSPSGDFM